MTGDVPRRIALITSSFHPHTGGVETHVRAVARELDRRGHTVEVWTVDRGEHLGEALVDGVRVRYLPTPLPARRAAALVGFAVSLPRALLAWWRAFRSLRPEVLHVHCFGPNGVYALALHVLVRVPLVVTSHGETFMDDRAVYGRSALLRAALRRALHEAALVTAPTNFVLTDLRERFRLDGGVVVPNGIDLKVGAIRPTGFPSVGAVALAVGRVERMKGFDLLLEASVDSRLAHVQIVLGGEGAETSVLREHARALGIEGRVHFLGLLTPAQVAAAMASADVVVVPSRLEAFGIVALEAWRSGTPLVGTVHGGMAEFVTHGVDGLLVDPTDTEALADAVHAVLTDRDLATALARTGTSRVRESSWPRVAEAYADLYPRCSHG